MSLRKALVRALILPVLCTLGVGAGAVGNALLVSHDVIPQTIGVAAPRVQGTAPAPHVPLSTRLVESHGCWAGEAPPDVVAPGHVVVTRDGTTRYAGPVVTGHALEQIFEGVDHGLTVHAFCR